jgi:DNA-binding IclR family transcriptional regulator
MEQTVAKAMALLEALVRASQPQRLTDLASGLGMTKPNVHRLLGTLSELGYAQQDATTSLYRPTLKVYELGAELVGRADVMSLSTPVLERLAAQAQESALLTVFDSGYVVYVKKVDSPRPIKAIAAVGTRVPASCVSTGKVLLAWLPESALEATLPLLRKFTPLTKTTRRAIERDLLDARQLGYATNRGEWRPGICGIAAPVRDWLGNVIAAVGVWGAEEDLLGARRPEVATLTMAAANEISRSLGYLNAPPALAMPGGASVRPRRPQRTP